MLAKVIGFLWVLFGFLWLARPQALKGRLQRKMGRKTRWIVYGFLIVFGFLMMGSVIRTPGFLPKFIGVLGMVITIKAIMLLTSKTSEKFVTWWSERSMLFFRVLAAAFIALGGAMLYL